MKESKTVSTEVASPNSDAESAITFDEESELLAQFPPEIL